MSDNNDKPASNPMGIFPKTALTKEIVKYMYYMQGLTLEEIGRSFRVTKERIRQLMEEWNLPRFSRWERKN